MRTFSIILADDEQNILFGMQKGINWEELGFIVAGTAQNGKEVLEMMDDLHPDLVISDIKMPFMDGLELAKTIHDNYMNTKVILFSGWDDFEYARLAISYGVSEYLMKPIDYDEMKKLLIDMHQALEEEYNEKINWTRLENAYFKSLPLLRQQFFTQLVLGTMELEECHQQIKNLGLELDNKQYCIIAVKIQKVDHKDVFSALSIKETLKEALDKISKVYEFGIGDKEIFLLTGDKKHEIGKISRSIQEAAIMITRIFGVHISCGMSENTNQLEDIPTIYIQAKDALEYNLVVPDESYTYYNDLMLQEEVETDWNTTVEQIGKTITYCTEEEMKKPLVGIVCSYNEIVPGHMNLDKIAQAVKLGVAEAGGTPVMFPAIAVCDGIAMGHIGMKYSLVTRDLIADSTECMATAHQFDALVMIPNCDKNVPGLLMAAARVNVPTVFVSGGPMLAGHVKGHKTSLSSMFEAVGSYAAGKMTEEDVNDFECHACPTCGSCSGMYTANSMNCLTEALGMGLPGNGTIPAVYSERLKLAKRAGYAVMEMYKNNICPRDIITKDAIMNALTVDMALGCSTNSMLHIPAIAHEIGFDFDIAMANEVSARTPNLCHLAPAGPT